MTTVYTITTERGTVETTVPLLAQAESEQGARVTAETRSNL